MEIFGDKDKPIVLVNRIKELRKSKNITQEALCRILNIAQPTLSGYETNSYEPDFNIASKISDYFDVTLDYLIGRGEPTMYKTHTRKNIANHANVSANRIKELRINKGMSQSELADLLFLDKTAVSKWETYKNLPNQNILENLCLIFDVTLDYLLGLDMINTTEPHVFKRRADISTTPTNRIRALRKSKGITQQELAKVLNVDLSSVGKWEIHDFTPKKTTLFQLADYFDVSIDYLLGRADELCEQYPLRDVQTPFGNMENLTRNDLDEILKFIDYIKNRKKI